MVEIVDSMANENSEIHFILKDRKYGLGLSLGLFCSPFFHNLSIGVV